MAPSRIAGIILLVVGFILIALGYQGSQSVLDQTKHVFTGEFRDRTTFMLLGGTVAVVAGLIALVVPAGGAKRLGGGYAT